MVFRVVSVLVLVVIAGVIYPNDWTSFHVKVSSETGIDENLTLSWTFQVEGQKEVIASPVVSDGFLILCDYNGKVYCFDIEQSNNQSSAKLVWSYKTKGSSIVSTPIVHRGSVYVITKDGFVYAFSIETGDIYWTRSLFTEVVSSPVIVGNVLIVGTGSPHNGILALDIQNPETFGSKLWEFVYNSSPQPIFSSPLLVGNILYFGDNASRLFAFDINTLQLVSTFGTNGVVTTSGGFMYASCTHDGGFLYVAPGASDINVYKINAASGVKTLTVPIGGANSNSVTSGTVFKDGFVYFIGGKQGGQRLYRLNSSTGVISNVNLGTATDFPLSATPALVNNLLFVGSSGAKSFQIFDMSLNPRGTWSNLSGEIYASPAVSNGMVFVATNKGTLYAYKSNVNNAPSAPSTGFYPSESISINETQPTLQWNAVTTDETPASGLRYVVRFDTDGEVSFSWNGYPSDYITASGITTFVLPSAIPEDTRVTWRVRTIDAHGALSKWSQTQEFWIKRKLLPPEPPTDFFALPMDMSVQLKWKKSVSLDVKEYQLSYRLDNETSLDTNIAVSKNFESYTIGGLLNGQRYVFTLKTIDLDGNSSSSVTAKATPNPLISINGNAYSNVESAVSAAVSGSTVLLGPGTFKIVFPLTLKEGVSLIGFSPLHTVLDFSGLSTGITVTSVLGQPPAQIKNILLKGGGTGVALASAKLDIQNSVFTGMVNPINASVASELNVINNTIVSNNGNGIEVSNSALMLRNNIIMNNTGFGVMNIKSTVNGGYNCFYQNSIDNWLSEVSQTGNFVSDVKFLDKDKLDYREAEGSKAVDSGDPKDDYSNEPTPNGNRINIGAFGNTWLATKSKPSITDPPPPPPPGTEETGGHHSKRGLCIVATTVIGTVFEGKLEHFYGMRDKLLRTNLPGSDFVNLYYRISPPVAKYIDDKTTLKMLTRKILGIIHE